MTKSLGWSVGVFWNEAMPARLSRVWPGAYVLSLLARMRVLLCGRGAWNISPIAKNRAITSIPFFCCRQKIKLPGGYSCTDSPCELYKFGVLSVGGLLPKFLDVTSSLINYSWFHPLLITESALFLKLRGVNLTAL